MAVTKSALYSILQLQISSPPLEEFREITPHDAVNYTIKDNNNQLDIDAVAGILSILLEKLPENEMVKILNDCGNGDFE